MAARFLVSGGNGNWTSTTNWSATSGGSSGSSAPSSGDDVTFDINSGATNITTDASARAAKTLTVTADYTGTMTMTNQLTVSGSVTLGANMVIAGASKLIANGAGTLTSNGQVWPNGLDFNHSSVTVTLADNWTVTGSITFGSFSSTVNGQTLSVSGSVTFNGTTSNHVGTTSIVMAGTGTLSASTTTGNVRMPIEINSIGTVTLSGTLRYQTGTLKFTAFGSLVTTGFSLVLTAAATVTVNVSGVSIPTISVLAGNQTIGGSEGITIGTLSCLIPGVVLTLNSTETYSVTSGLVLTGSNASHILLSASTATSAFNLNYSGSTMALAYVNATDVDSSGGTAIYVYTGTLLRTTNWTSGTVIRSGSGGGLRRNPSLNGGCV